jgi:hypothetical protein
MKKHLATIDLDNNEGTGKLYWESGYIWCERVSDGETWNTETRCDSEETAVDVILAVWGPEGGSTWQLEIL